MLTKYFNNVLKRYMTVNPQMDHLELLKEVFQVEFIDVEKTPVLKTPPLYDITGKFKTSTGVRVFVSLQNYVDDSLITDVFVPSFSIKLTSTKSKMEGVWEKHIAVTYSEKEIYNSNCIFE